ncbi:MAG TPA: YbaB/EbfC family nucleoid-associated protein [Firmicutes bacterium]|jgi:DNA-binding YbaB/EbfC family protein|nr:YbaB/EbfC family nucleoid-associated protein [Bacillota bacterium]
MPKFPGPGGLDMQRLMKEAQKLQMEMTKVEEELANKTVEGTSGGGMVKAVITCSFQVKSIEIAPEVVDPDDIEMLQDLIVAAVNAGITKARDTSQEEMAKVTGGLNMPVKW